MVDEMGYGATIHGLAEAAVALPTHMPTVLLHGMLPLSTLLDHCTDDPLLRAILSIQCGDHGMAPSRAPAALHAGLQAYYFDGGCYPKGGGHHIPDTLMRHIRRHGGAVKLGVEVERILIEDGRAIGVRLADGQEIRAGIVVSNADPGVTWGRLVEPEHLPWRLRHRIEHLHYSISTLSLFMAVDMDLRAAGIDSGNIWYSRTPDIDAVYSLADRQVLTGQEVIPGLFFNVTTLKDPSLRHDGLHTVEAITVASIDPFSRWQDTPPGQRPAEYAQLKADLTERILDAVECFVPGLRERTVFRTLGTPLTNQHFLHATRGGIYGTEKTVGNLGPFGFAVDTHIHGLYQCGASIIAPGINGVTTSGLQAAAAALGCTADELLTAHGAVAAHLSIGAPGGLAGRIAAPHAGAPADGLGGGAIELTGEVDVTPDTTSPQEGSMMRGQGSGTDGEPDGGGGSRGDDGAGRAAGAKGPRARAGPAHRRHAGAARRHHRRGRRGGGSYDAHLRQRAAGAGQGPGPHRRHRRASARQGQPRSGVRVVVHAERQRRDDRHDLGAGERAARRAGRDHQHPQRRYRPRRDHPLGGRPEERPAAVVAPGGGRNLRRHAQRHQRLPRHG